MKKKLSYVQGFSLIELIVVITVLGTLIVASLSFIDPMKQLNKFSDGRRQEDINQIKTALDTYYNDNSCYPGSLLFGETWTENTVTYMRSVPQDPDCSEDPTKCYIYQYSGDCPQWNVVFAKLSKTPEKSACPLTSLSSCLPVDYDDTWACTISGNVDCSYLSTISLSNGSMSSDPTPTPTIPVGPTNTPMPTAEACTPRNWACTGSPAQCNAVPAGTGTFCESTCGGGC